MSYKEWHGPISLPKEETPVGGLFLPISVIAAKAITESIVADKITYFDTERYRLEVRAESKTDHYRKVNISTMLEESIHNVFSTKENKAAYVAKALIIYITRFNNALPAERDALMKECLNLYVTNWSKDKQAKATTQQSNSNNIPQQTYSNNIPQQTYNNNIPQQTYSNNIPQQVYQNQSNIATIQDIPHYNDNYTYNQPPVNTPKQPGPIGKTSAPHIPAPANQQTPQQQLTNTDPFK
jgi:hypothetical protein